MPLEIERKFLVRTGAWQPSDDGQPMAQGYVVTGPPVSVRVRVAGDRGFLTLKKDRGEGIRTEFEYEIPLDEAEQMLSELCTGRVVEKTRYRQLHEGHLWEVDVFHGANAGLTVAEIELDRLDSAFTRPPWLGEEVTADRRYLNSCLAMRPYTTWFVPTPPLLGGD